MEVVRDAPGKSHFVLRSNRFLWRKKTEGGFCLTFRHALKIAACLTVFYNYDRLYFKPCEPIEYCHYLRKQRAYKRNSTVKTIFKLGPYGYRQHIKKKHYLDSSRHAFCQRFNSQIHRIPWTYATVICNKLTYGPTHESFLLHFHVFLTTSPLWKYLLPDIRAVPVLQFCRSISLTRNALLRSETSLCNSPIAFWQESMEQIWTNLNTLSSSITTTHCRSIHFSFL